MRLTLLTIALLSLSVTAEARPVSYPSGWTVMIKNDFDSNSSHIHYSPTKDYSIGWRHEYLRDPKAHMDVLQVNTLLKRWNAPASQGNLYFKTGAGVAYDSGHTEPAAFGGIAMDWENRRTFVSYENRFLWTNGIDDFAHHSARVGIAPYIGDYGDLHTWLMLQTDYHPEDSDAFSLTPLVRFFKGTHKVELGYNIKEHGLLVNYIKRF